MSSRICLLLLAALSSGCSFIFVTPAPANVSQPTPHPYADCTSSRVAPVLDGILTGYELVRVGLAAQASDSDYARLPINRGTDLALGAASAALFLSSTIYGVLNTSACYRLKQGPALGEEMPGITREPEPDAPAPPPARAKDAVAPWWDATPPLATPDTAPSATPPPRP